MLWAFASVGLILLAAWMALQAAISRNGPAVLDTVDRLTGGDREVSLLHNTSLGDSPFQKLAVYGGDDADNRKPVVIFAHGGSWRAGDPDDYGFVARGLAPEGFVVVLSGYRLGDAGKFPAMLEDTAKAVAWTRSNIAQYGGDPEAIFIAGHSAGAYNAAMVALDRQWLENEGLGNETIAGFIGLAGPYDFYPFDSDSTKASFGDAPEPEKTQPVNFVRGDAPPLLLLTGEQDATVKPRNTRVLATAITQAGGIAEAAYYPSFDHTGILTALASPWRRDSAVIDRIAGFVRGVTDRKRASATQASVPVKPETR